MDIISCGVIASRPLLFPWGYDEHSWECVALKLKLLNRITQLISDGVTDFFVAIDAGFGLYAAEMLGGLRTIVTDLDLTCVVPWEGQATQWTPELRERYFTQLGNATDVVQLHTTKTAACELDALLKVVESSNAVIAICSQDDPLLHVIIQNAEKQNKLLIKL